MRTEKEMESILSSISISRVRRNGRRERGEKKNHDLAHKQFLSSRLISIFGAINFSI
jgi:hypothetical protein